MTSSTFPRQDADQATLQLEFRGRRFPQSWNPESEQPRDLVRQLAEPAREVSLPVELESTLWQLLVWAELSPAETQRQTLVESYIRSLNQLDGFRRDIDKLIRAACLANLDFRQGTGTTHEGARDAAIRSTLDDMLAAAAADWPAPKNVLDGTVASQAEPALAVQLEEALRNSVQEFVANFFDLLARLVDRQLVGLIEWLPNHCCSYHFFKQVVIQENEGGSRVVREAFFDDFSDPSQPGPDVIGKRRTLDVRSQGRHYRRLARHEHSVMNAVRTSIGNSRVVMPPQVVAMLENVPDWLYPFIEVLDGDIIRERIIERDIRVETWADTVVRDEPIYGWEPCVLIGSYVLTGWGPREVQAEQARRKTAQLTEVRRTEQKYAAWRAPLFAVAAVAMTVLALVLLAASLRGQGGSAFALLATAAAIGAAWQAVFDFFTARQNQAQAAMAAHWLAASYACQLLLALWLVARWFGPMWWGVPIVLGATAVVCYVIGRRFC